MFSWLSANLANLAITAILVLAVALAVRSMIRNRKAGKSSCGCDCGSCGACSGGSAGNCKGMSEGSAKGP